MTAWYNENDPKAAAWLRELIKEGLIADGVVDERSIVDVDPRELDGYRQCHFFAGIGGWSYALRLAGWPDDEPVWTGSCPCQPFSAAGKRLGTADERHLWPEFHRLITECRPPVVFGEQVAAKAGREWLSRVRADLEAVGYAVGAADLCAASVGAPHIRQRLYWLAHAECRTRQFDRYEMAGETRGPEGSAQERQWLRIDAGDGKFISGLEQSESSGRIERRAEPSGRSIEPRCGLGGLGDADDERPQGWCEYAGEHGGQRSAWATGELLPCLDGKARRVEPGTFPLAHGVPARVGRLRGYGNAIVPQVAAEFIRAYAGL